MKNSTLKLLATFLLTLLVYTVNAQVEPVCQGDEKEYAVDLADGTDGTAGSTYVWTITPTAPATFNGTQTNVTTTGNHIRIDWGTSPLGIYTLSVIETNATGCETDPPVTLTIEIVAKPVIPTVIGNPTAICSGDDAVFTITGGIGNIVSYTVNGVPATTPPLVDGDGDGNGEFDVIITSPTVAQTIILTSVANDTSATACTLDLTNPGPAPTATITINAAPVTSPIQAL